jgi:hypothetical protein
MKRTLQKSEVEKLILNVVSEEISAIQHPSSRPYYKDWGGAQIFTTGEFAFIIMSRTGERFGIRVEELEKENQ